MPLEKEHVDLLDDHAKTVGVNIQVINCDCPSYIVVIGQIGNSNFCHDIIGVIRTGVAKKPPKGGFNYGDPLLLKCPHEFSHYLIEDFVHAKCAI